MNAVCQVPASILTLAALLWFGGVVSAGETHLRERPLDSPKIVVAPIPSSDFSTVRLLDPELAACIVLAGGAAPKNESPVNAPQTEPFAAALQRLLSAVSGDLPPGLRVFYGFLEKPAVTATALGGTVLLLLPESEPTTAVDAARAAATAWLLAHKIPAAPEGGVNELVLRVAESLAWLGSLALANTPPELLPLHQWVEPKSVAPALENFLRQTLDGEEPYRIRRARLREVTLPGRASPELAQAAAYLVETFGQPSQARDHPMALLRAWAENRSKRFPPPPRVLRSALANPVRFGLGKKLQNEDRALLWSDEALRAAWALPPSQELPPGAPVEALRVWQARRRSQGLAVPAPSGLVRSQGYFLVKPEPPGYALVWANPQGEELVLLWPRWVLSPQLDPNGEDLLFIDSQGLWRVSLKGEGVEQVHVGDFRAVAVSPSGRALAVLAWPKRELWLLPSGQVLASASGFCWLTEELLVVAEGGELSIVDMEQQKGRTLPFPCSGPLACTGAKLLAAVSEPCPQALVRVEVGTGEPVTLLQLPQPAADLVPVGENLAFLTADGVFLLTKDGGVKRVDRALALGGS